MVFKVRGTVLPGAILFFSHRRAGLWHHVSRGDLLLQSLSSGPWREIKATSLILPHISVSLEQ